MIVSLLVVLLSALMTATLLRITLTKQPTDAVTAPKELQESDITNNQLQIIKNNLFTYPQEWSYYCKGIENNDLIPSWQYVHTQYKKDVPSVTSAVIAEFQAAFKTEREYNHPGNWSASVTIDEQGLQALGENPEVYIYEHTYTETSMVDYGKTKNTKNKSNCIGFLKHVNQAEKRFTKVDTQPVKYFLDKIVASNYGLQNMPGKARFVASTATDDGKDVVYQYYLDSPRYATCNKTEGGDALMSHKTSLGGTCSDGYEYNESGGYITLNTLRIAKQNGTYQTYPSGLVVPNIEQRLRYSGTDIKESL